MAGVEGSSSPGFLADTSASLQIEVTGEAGKDVLTAPAVARLLESDGRTALASSTKARTQRGWRLNLLSPPDPSTT